MENKLINYDLFVSYMTNYDELFLKNLALFINDCFVLRSELLLLL